ncbi:hypothetical protein HAX54_010876 [Datura stramonium]|uniref:Uncharacterized protein n=1 Tax=Datura stramonium TaxID=4076 RepID=A0ABS8TID5_DATST|nr:hypothetical protein [Datura stramonium]
MIHAQQNHGDQNTGMISDLNISSNISTNNVAQEKPIKTTVTLNSTKSIESNKEMPHQQNLDNFKGSGQNQSLKAKQVQKLDIDSGQDHNWKSKQVQRKTTSQEQSLNSELVHDFDKVQDFSSSGVHHQCSEQFQQAQTLGLNQAIYRGSS